MLSQRPLWDRLIYPAVKPEREYTPAVKLKKKKEKAREGGSVALDLGPPPVLCSQCAIRENSHRRLLVPLFGIELCRARSRRAGGARKRRGHSFQNGFLIKGTGITLLCYRLYSVLLLLYSDKILTLRRLFFLFFVFLKQLCNQRLLHFTMP